MNEIKKNMDTIGWSMENSYLSLPNHCYAKATPDAAQEPVLILKNVPLADELSLSLNRMEDAELAKIFSGTDLPEGATPIAQAYAGHQFGNFTMLGDGRAHLIGEHSTAEGLKVDIQLKGSGRTPFSRGGDGKGALGPMLREYLISEMMHGLGIPTTRSLAVVATGEPVYRETVHPGAVLTRVAQSHIRVGTFQYLLALKDANSLKKMADYAIKRHYPDIIGSDNPYLAFLDAVIARQIDLVVNWMRVGFIHGVMNTDNMTISGETIDYGPCAFMDAYDPKTVFSSIDYHGRYAFANQPPAANWNLVRFAETLLPLIHDDFDEAVKLAEPLTTGFSDRFHAAWLEMMRKKLGLFGMEQEDQALIEGLLTLMEKEGMDYTNTFRDLSQDSLPDDKVYQSKAFKDWHASWKKRQTLHQPSEQACLELMKANNPALIARNHKIEEALNLAEEQGDLSLVHRLLDGFTHPYDDSDDFAELKLPASAQERVYQTFCGT